MADVFGRAIRDWDDGNLDEPLLERDGDERREHPIERYYFTDPDRTDPFRQWWDGHLDGPLLDVGAGAGTDALYWQDGHELVAIEVSDALVALMDERGVTDARQADMFALPDHFEAGRFRSVTAKGTQIGLAGSRAGLEAFLEDLATVTAPDATAVLDMYDPSIDATTDLLGYRPDPERASRSGPTTSNTEMRSGRRCASDCSVPTGCGRSRGRRRGPSSTSNAQPRARLGTTRSRCRRRDRPACRWLRAPLTGGARPSTNRVARAGARA